MELSISIELSAVLLLTHHGDFLSLDGHIGTSKVAQSSDSSNTSRIHQVPIMIQHVNIYSDLPHLSTHTIINYAR